MRSVHRLQLAGVLGVTLAGCERPGVSARNDTVQPQPPPPSVAVDTSVPATPVPAAWDTLAGPLFLVRGPSGDQASVVIPRWDSTTSIDTVEFETREAYRATFELFSLHERGGTATLSAPVPLDLPQDCTAWPTARLHLQGDSTAWTVAWVAGRIEAIPVDTLARLASADSARLVREIARVASALGTDTVEALRGLPYVVRQAYRWAVTPQRSVVLAEVTRTLPQEANPLQEHLVIVAEGDSGKPRLGSVYAERTTGGEELLESTELLFTGRVKANGHLIVLLARYAGDGVVYALLERDTAGRWRLRWSSAYAGC